MQETVQEQVSQQFHLDGELLPLDLINTEKMVKGKPRDILATPEDLREWWQVAQQQYPQIEAIGGGGQADMPYDIGLLEQVKALRGALRSIFAAITHEVGVEQADVEVLNKALGKGNPYIGIAGVRKLQATFCTHNTSVDQILFAIALASWQFIEQGDMQRLHQCANEKCILFFYDTTKSATRRWCSLGCMDRARSAQRYKAKKAAQAD